MALFQLSRIAITESFADFVEGDLLECSYNDSTELIEVTKNGSTIIKGKL